MLAVFEGDLYPEGRARPRPLGAPVRDPRVVLLKTSLGDDASLLESVLQGPVDGVVVNLRQVLRLQKEVEWIENLRRFNGTDYGAPTACGTFAVATATPAPSPGSR